MEFSNRDEWLAARGLGLGSSDAPAILGVSRYKSPLQLYCEKLGLVERGPMLERQKWGLVLEAPIADAFEQETGRAVLAPPPHTIQVHDTLDWLRCSVDRYQVPEAPKLPPPCEGVGVLEVKNADIHLGSEWTSEPPIEYQVQLQHQLAVTGYQWGSIAALIGGNHFVWQDLKRDEDFIAILMAEEEKFYKRLLEKTPPPPDGSDGTKKLLAQLYPKDTGVSIALPVEAVDWDERMRELKGVVKQANEEIQYFENLIKDKLKDATTGALPNGAAYVWKYQTRAGYTVEPTEFRMFTRKDSPDEKKAKKAAKIAAKEGTPDVAAPESL